MKTLLRSVSTFVITFFITCQLSAQATTFVVVNVNNSGQGSLRQAITDAMNSTATATAITFNLPAGNNIITLTTEILLNPARTGKTLSINGYNPFNSSSKIILRGTGTRSIIGLRCSSTLLFSLEVYGLQFENFAYGIVSSSVNTIGGVGTKANVFVNNTCGVFASENSSVIGNYIGTDKNFTAGLGNATGVEFYGTNREISISDNYICSNTNGIFVHPPSGGVAKVLNNIIGTNNTKGTRTDLGNTYSYYGYDTNGGTSSAYFDGNTLAYSKSICLAVDKYEIRKNNFICNSGTLISNRTTPYTAPIVSSIAPNHYNGVSITGTSANANDSIYIFQRDPSVCSTTPCQGEWVASAVANANKQWTAYATVAPGKQITFIATQTGREIIIGRSLLSYTVGTSSQLTGCYSITCPSLTINLTAQSPVLCYGGKDGSVRLSIVPNGYTYFDFGYKLVNTATNAVVASGTINPYTSQSTPFYITGLSAGTYNVIISNPINFCTYTSSKVTVTQPNAPLSMSSCREVSPVSSTTAADGVGQVVVSGGTPSYNLSIVRPNGTTFTVPSQTSGTFNLTGLAPGTYNVTAYDLAYSKGVTNTGCTATCSFTISTPTCTNLKVGVNQVTNPLCYGGLGSLKIKCTDSPNNLPLTLSLSNGFSQTISSFSIDSTVTISNLPTGNYTITLKNRLNCSVTTTATITQPNIMGIFCDTNVTNALRVGEASGSERVFLSGGVTPYTLALTGAEVRTIAGITVTNANYTIPNLKAGVYNVKITDANGCSSGTCTFRIKDPDCSDFKLTATVENIRCFGEKNGKITLVIPDGLDPSNYLWSTNAATGDQPFAENLGVGTYSVTTTDYRLCKDTTTARITTPSVLTTSVSKTDVSTVNGANGSATVTASGGTPPYNAHLNLNGTSISPTTQTTTTFTFNNLTKGTYIALTTDANGCSKWDTIRINDPNCNFVIRGQADSVTCYNGNNGRIMITNNAIGIGVNYAWSQTGIGNSATATNLRVGTYSVTASTLQNCIDSLTIDVFQPDSIAISAFPNDAKTVGGSTGSIDVTISGGTQPYTVKIGTTTATQKSPTSFIFNNLPKGTYSFLVTDAKGCTKTQTATINDPDCSLMSLDKQVDSVLCKGGATGKITIVTNNAVAPVSYLWTPPSVGTGAVANNLTAGTYAVTATDSRNCKASLSVTVFEPAALIATHTTSNVTTINGSDGRIRVTINGGTPPYIVQKDTTTATAQSVNIFNFTNLKSGTYLYTATDANGCSTSQTVTITEPTCSLAIAKTVTQVACFGQPNGSITNTITGARLPITTVWNTGATTPNLNNLAVGTYFLTVTDSIGCRKIDSTIITQPTALAVNITSTNITRLGTSNGTITLTASGGTPTYALSMTLNSASISPTSQAPPQYNYTNLGAGTYQFTFTDAKGCTKTGSVIITEPTCRLTLPAATIVYVSCNGGANGSIIVNPTGGNGALTYTWNPVQTGNSNNLTNLTAGFYRLTVTDTSGCTVRDSMRVLEPAALTSTPSVTNVSTIGGNNGSINIIIRGGTVPYTVTRGTPSVNATRLTDSTFVFNTLTKGTYTYTVTDSKGCITSATVTVNDPTCGNLTITPSVTNVNCKGDATGRIDIAITGGAAPFTYAWNPTNLGTTSTASNLKAGSYTISVTDAVGCSQSQSINVTEPNLVLSATSSATPTTTTTASDGTITVNVSGGTSPYIVRSGVLVATTQTPTSFIFNGLVSRDYTFTVTDSKNCTTTGNATVGSPNCNFSVQSQVNAVKCNGEATGSILVTTSNAVGSVTFAWIPNTVGTGSSALNLPAGVYTFTATDGRNCSQSRTVTVTEPPKLDARSSKKDVVSIGASDGSISVVAVGGTPPYTVTLGTTTGTQIRPDSFVFNGLARGNYTFILKDANGCTASQTVNINDPSCGNVSAILTEAQKITCFGGANGRLNLAIANFVTPQYNWNPSSIGNIQNPTDLKAGVYSVTVSDSRGCSATAQITLTEPAQIKATIAGGARICRGDSTVLRFTVENATNFVLTYTEGGQSFMTSALQAVVKPQFNTEYSLVSVVSGTCSGSVSTNIVTVNVTVPTGVAAIRSLKDSLCQGDTLVLIPSINGNQYVWHRPNLSDTITMGSENLIIPNVNASNSGNYTLQVRQSGCLSPNSEPKRITVFPKPTERANAGIDKSVCEGSATTLTATAIASQNVTGRWVSVNPSAVVTQPTSNNTTATNLTVGNNPFIWVLSSATCGEFSRDTVAISVSGKPELEASPTINLDSKLTSALINTRELLKNKSLDPSVFIIKNLKFPDKAKVTVQNNSIYFDRNDLIDAQTVDVEFEICSTICPTVCNKGKVSFVLEQLVDNTDFSVPKVFALNSSSGSSLNIDGLEFFLDGEVTIVNRWGSIVFGPTIYKNNTPEKSWNGQKNGTPLPTGAYYYFIKYKDKDVLKIKKGIIYLIEE